MPSSDSNSSFVDWTPPEGFTKLAKGDMPFPMQAGQVALSNRRFYAVDTSSKDFREPVRSYWGWMMDGPHLRIHEQNNDAIWVGVLPALRPIFDPKQIKGAREVNGFPFEFLRRGTLFSENGETWNVNQRQAAPGVAGANRSYGGDNKTYIEMSKGTILVDPYGRSLGGPCPQLWFAAVSVTRTAINLEPGTTLACTSPDPFGMISKVGGHVTRPSSPKSDNFNLVWENASDKTIQLTMHSVGDVTLTLKSPTAPAAATSEAVVESAAPATEPAAPATEPAASATAPAAPAAPATAAPAAPATAAPAASAAAPADANSTMVDILTQLQTLTAHLAQAQKSA